MPPTACFNGRQCFRNEFAFNHLTCVPLKISVLGCANIYFCWSGNTVNGSYSCFIKNIEVSRNHACLKAHTCQAMKSEFFRQIKNLQNSCLLGRPFGLLWPCNLPYEWEASEESRLGKRIISNSWGQCSVLWAENEKKSYLPTGGQREDGLAQGGCGFQTGGGVLQGTTVCWVYWCRKWSLFGPSSSQLSRLECSCVFLVFILCHSPYSPGQKYSTVWYTPTCCVTPTCICPWMSWQI